MDAAARALTRLRAHECVCCLECGEVYSKPVAGSIAETNPGCPACGYLGWIPLNRPGEPTVTRRPGEDRLRRRSARSH